MQIKLLAGRLLPKADLTDWFPENQISTTTIEDIWDPELRQEEETKVEVHVKDSATDTIVHFWTTFDHFHPEKKTGNINILPIELIYVCQEPLTERKWFWTAMGTSLRWRFQLLSRKERWLGFEQATGNGPLTLNQIRFVTSSEMKL